MTVIGTASRETSLPPEMGGRGDVSPNPVPDPAEGKYRVKKKDRNIEAKHRVLKASLFQEKLAAMGFKDYDEYLASQSWKDKKAEYAQSDRSKHCENCGRLDYILHHLTYLRLGNEDLDDFLALCPACHHKLHEDMRQHGRWIYKARTALNRLRKITEHGTVKQRRLAVQQQDDFLLYPPELQSILNSLQGLEGYALRAIARESARLLTTLNATEKRRRKEEKGQWRVTVCMDRLNGITVNQDFEGRMAREN